MYLDIVVGALIGWLVAFWSGESPPTLMAFGVLATLAPDIDFFVWLARHRWRIDQLAHEHRDLLHRPLLFGLGGGLLIALWHPLYGLVWFLGTMAHFIHDTYDGGWGIAWLHPFYPGYFTLASYSPKRHIRNFAEQRALALMYGTAHWTDWKDGTPRNVVRFAVAVSVLILVVVVITYWLLIR